MSRNIIFLKNYFLNLTIIVPVLAKYFFKRFSFFFNALESLYCNWLSFAIFFKCYHLRLEINDSFFKKKPSCPLTALKVLTNTL